MIVPPFKKQHAQAHARDGSPQFHIRALNRGCSDLRVFANLELVARLDVALVDIEKIGAKRGAVSSDAQAIDTLFNGVAKNEFIGFFVNGNCSGRATWQSDLRCLFWPDKREPECFTRLYQELLAFGVGGIEPIRGVLVEHRKGDTIW